MRPRFRLVHSVLFAASSALISSSCYSPGDGVEPNLETLYFPTGLALDGVSRGDGGETQGQGESKYLYVASSDFDLQYRSSSLASYDLVRMRKTVPFSCNTDADCAVPGLSESACDNQSRPGDGANPLLAPSFFCVPTSGEYAGKPCGALGERSLADRLLSPGRCNSVNPNLEGEQKLLHDSVGIGAFATEVVMKVNPDDTQQSRLYLPVRGDATLHWIELQDGKFECGQGQNADRSCNDLHRSGDSTADNNNQLRQPAEPFGIAVTPKGDYVAITNQTTGSVSLFANSWDNSVGPKLESILRGLPSAPVAIAAIPTSGLPTEAEVAAGAVSSAPGFLVAYRNAAQLDLLRVRSDKADMTTSGASYTRFALTDAGTVAINANSTGFDSRSIVIDDAQRQEDYDDCTTLERSCLLQARQPKVYIANRAPASLLVGAMVADGAYQSGSSDLPAFVDSVALTSGPSRVLLGNVKVPVPVGELADEPPKSDGQGLFKLERRVFVVCFDSRRIFVYDPKRRVIEAIISTGRGPYALAVDDARGLAYVAHFTDSYLGVVSLDQRFPKTYGSIVASIGAPTPPRSSK